LGLGGPSFKFQVIFSFFSTLEGNKRWWVGVRKFKYKKFNAQGTFSIKHCQTEKTKTKVTLLAISISYLAVEPLMIKPTKSKNIRPVGQWDKTRLLSAMK
jgi:hypothetical protein